LYHFRQRLARVVKVEPRQRTTQLAPRAHLRRRHVGVEEPVEAPVEERPALLHRQRLAVRRFQSNLPRAHFSHPIRSSDVRPRQGTPVHRAHVLEDVRRHVAHVDDVRGQPGEVADAVGRRGDHAADAIAPMAWISTR
jgi:hypothetical protein